MRRPTLNSPEQEAGWAFAEANPEQATRQQIADAAGVSTGTVGRWLKAWRDELGDDLFRGEVAERRAEQTAAAREASEIKWAELRIAEARNAGVTASRIRARILELLPTVGTVWVDRGASGNARPVPMSGPAGAQIKALADATARLLEIAELLDGRPTRHTQRSVPSDQWQPPGVLADVMSDDEKRAKVIDMRQRLLDREASGS